jgi:hypothetical protein
MLIGRLQVADRYQRAGRYWRQGRCWRQATRRRCVRWPELTSAANRLGSMRMMPANAAGIKKGSKAAIDDHMIRPSAHQPRVSFSPFLPRLITQSS